MQQKKLFNYILNKEWISKAKQYLYSVHDLYNLSKLSLDVNVSKYLQLEFAQVFLTSE